MNAIQPDPAAPSIGSHNQSVMDSLSKAKRVAAILARSGFTVLDGVATKRNARITIREPIRGAAIITSDAAPIRYTPYDTTYATSVEGVQVEWTIRRVP